MTVRRRALAAASRCGVFAAARAALARNGSFALELHGVCSVRRPSLPTAVEPSFSADQLEQLLRWLEPRFRFLDAERFLSGEGRGVLLTFDDGFANQFEVALPVLERYRAPAVFFVTTQHVLDPKDWLPSVRRALTGTGITLDPAEQADLCDGLSPAQLGALARHPLATIGSHTTTHPRLTGLSDELALAELVDSRAYLAAACGPVDLLAYPYGDHDRRVTRLARRAGYRAAFAERAPRAGEPSMAIERVGLYDCAPGYLDAKTSGLFGRAHRPRPLLRPMIARRSQGDA